MAAQDRRWSRATRSVHVPVPQPDEQPVAPPLYQTATFAFDDAARYATALTAPDAGYSYTRYHNPTTAAFEGALVDLEGGAAALATASGMAAITTVLLTLAGPGDRVVSSRELYGGTYGLFSRLGERLRLDVALVDVGDHTAVDKALAEGARALYVETIANPTMAVADLPALAALADEHGVPLVVDNTVASPLLCRPLEHGASVVVHSATKYLGGHSDVVAGVAVFADADLHKQAWEVLIDTGPSADPFAAWLLLRGLKTLPLRMARHSETATAVAEFLTAQPKVDRVWFPGLATHPTHRVATRVLEGPSGFLSFEVAGGRDAARRFCESTTLGRLAASLGGPETLVSPPATTTHRQYDDAALAAAGIPPGMVRVSVGLEDASDLMDDFAAALHEI
jgi:cystathionine beta-lyase/cystathionine gamma-synthase